jgi:hypothetical protein
MIAGFSSSLRRGLPQQLSLMVGMLLPGPSRHLGFARQRPEPANFPSFPTCVGVLVLCNKKETATTTKMGLGAVRSGLQHGGERLAKS